MRRLALGAGLFCVVFATCLGLSALLATGAFAKGRDGALALPAPPQPATQARAEASPAVRAKLVETYGKLPLAFEENKGQTDAQVKYLSRGAGYALFLTPTEAVLALSKSANSGAPHLAGIAPGADLAALAKPDPTVAKKTEQAVLRMSLQGANPVPKVEGQDAQAGHSNYFSGADSSKWVQGVARYGKVAYEGVYPDIDLVYYGNQGQLEYDFVVAPWADPEAIRMTFAGADRMEIDAAGNLVLTFGNDRVVQHAPLIYQERDGVRTPVAGGYVPIEGGTVGIRVATHDAALPLVIDPVLEWATYLGGSGDDQAFAITMDGSGNVYLAGMTSSSEFPVTAAVQGTFGGGMHDAFVARLTPAGALEYATYLGGSSDDQALAIAVDASGNAYVAGFTSGTFPVTAGAAQGTFAGGNDAFVARLTSAGALDYASYLGGSGADGAEGIAVDGSGNAYVAGYTLSIDFPVTEGVAQGTSGGFFDAFVARMTPAGALAYATYFGRSGADVVYGIAADGLGNVYVAGYTNSTDLPVTAGAAQATFGGGSYDAYMAQLTPSGVLEYATYLGGGWHRPSVRHRCGRLWERIHGGADELHRLPGHGGGGTGDARRRAL